MISLFLYNRPLVQLSYAHFVCCVLKGVFQTPWPCRGKLRTPLRSWGFPFSILFVQHFSVGGSEVVGGFSLTRNFLSSCWVFPSAWCSRRSPLLLLGWSFTPLSYGRFIRALSCPKRFPVFSGLQNYRRDCSAPASDVLVILLSDFLFFFLVTKNVAWDLFPDLL